MENRERLHNLSLDLDFELEDGLYVTWEERKYLAESLRVHFERELDLLLELKKKFRGSSLFPDSGARTH